MGTSARRRVRAWAVCLTVQFDDEYEGGPAHPMPSWFGDELDRNPVAKQSWAGLTPSRPKEILRYFAGLESQQAQQRNVQKALHVLTGGKARFMARSWNTPGDE
jgi:Bacteriocin-protection, YdeI or OmpD-Associated